MYLLISGSDSDSGNWIGLNVKCDLCANFVVNETYFDKFQHRLYKVEFLRFIKPQLEYHSYFYSCLTLFEG